MPEFKNKPSVVLRGSTWDAKHLDSFLASQWGEKLFRSKRPSEHSGGRSQLPFLYSNSSIRPSAAFLALSRDRPPVQALEKLFGDSLAATGPDKKPYTLPIVELDEISKKLNTIETQKKKDELEYIKTIPPSKRRQLFEAEKHRNKVYSELKQQKLTETKRDRILQNEYRSGIIGVNISKSPNDYNKKIQEIEHQNDENRKTFRMHNIMNYTAPSANIQFFNTGVNEAEKDKPRGLKRVEEIPEHYHDTQKALFEPKFSTTNPERTQRLKELWRGNRDFDIISGSYFNI